MANFGFAALGRGTAMSSPVELLVKGADKLGECPIWDERAQALYWVDIDGPLLQRHDPASRRSEHWSLPSAVGSIALRRAGGLLLALKGGIFRVPAAGAAPELFAALEQDKPGNRLNDGRCDAAGRFWVGSMSEHSRAPVGSLYCVEPNGRFLRHSNELVVPNSLAWSPDGRVMYFADTHRHTIWAFDYDPARGEARNRRVFRDTSSHPGQPDGSAIDAEGCLWNCEYGGWRVVRYRPDGEIDRTIALPAANPTCCCFGGADFRTLYITTATERLTQEELAKQPHAGSVFAVATEVAGLPEHRFGG
jgi:L-arabinonolactonase